jgi:hypothetical protein
MMGRTRATCLASQGLVWLTQICIASQEGQLARQSSLNYYSHSRISDTVQLSFCGVCTSVLQHTTALQRHWPVLPNLTVSYSRQPKTWFNELLSRSKPNIRSLGPGPPLSQASRFGRLGRAPTKQFQAIWVSAVEQLYPPFLCYPLQSF